MIYTRLLVPLFCLFLFSISINAQIIYVQPNGSGDGSSWDSATDLQDALTIAKADDEIWVASGTYYPTYCIDCTASERDIPFVIPDSVSLYAGFIGDEVDISQRDWENQPTILSGDIDQDGDLNNNSFTIVYTKNVSDQTVIDGFTITGANADSLGGYGIRQNSGGGLYNDGTLDGNQSNPILRNCTITNNVSLAFGAGIYDNGSFLGHTTLYLNNCVISDNTSGQNGAGIYHDGSFGGQSNPIITSCVIANNLSAASGGGIYSTGNENGQNNLSISFTEFNNNEATVYGGAILMQSHNATNLANFDHVTFIENQADIGGACYIDGSYDGLNEMDMYECAFLSNHSVASGGALFIDGSYGGLSKPTIRHCEFRMNSCDGSGGAVFNNAIEGESSPEITGCEFSENNCLTYGACLFNLGKTGISNPIITSSLFYNNEAYSAGVMYSLGSEEGVSNPLLTNCTIYNNYAVHSAGAFNNNAGLPEEGGICKPTFNNCIIWGNKISNNGIGPIFKNNNAEIDINYSLVDENTCFNLNVGVGSTVNCGSGMRYNLNPLFIDSLANNLKLQEDSPVIDIGDNLAINTLNSYLDIEGHVRVHNGNVDMGAYEFDAPFYFSPSFVFQSEDQSICTGQNVVLEVEVEGAGLLFYQWQQNGENIIGATENTLALNNVSLASAGAYTCEVTSILSEIIISDVVDITIDQQVVAAIDVTASTTVICAEEEVLFTAFTENGGSDPIYQWQLNGENVGTNSDTYTNSNLAENDEVVCVFQSSEVCVDEEFLTSNMIVMSVGDNSMASINITTPDLNTCQGDVMTFIAEVENGGSNPVYQWQLNGENVGQNSNLFTSAGLSEGDEVICLLSSSSLCFQNTTVSSNSITVNVDEPLVVEATITASSTNVCEGEEIIFSIQATNEGSAPQYEWNVNGTIVEIGTTFTTSLLEEGDQVFCVLTSSETCVENTIVNSNSITVNVDEPLVVEATIMASSTNVCEGEEIIFSIQATNEGSAPQYEWNVNGTIVEIGTTFTTSLLEEGDQVFCVLTSSETCVENTIVNSNSITVNVDEPLVVEATIMASSTNLCDGEEITFFVQATNEGSTPQYEWNVNGTIVETGTTFTTSLLEEGDEVFCVLTSSESCVETSTINSNIIAMSVDETMTLEAMIEANTNFICEGGEITFSATANSTSVIYEWRVNGNIIGNSSAIFATSNLSDGDIVSCLVTTDTPCFSNPSIFSNSIEVSVEEFLMPTIIIESTAEVFCQGEEIVYTATTTNGGETPFYQWQVNGVDVGSSTPIFTSSNLSNNDIISCTLSSSEPCLQQNSVASNQITIEIQNNAMPEVDIEASAITICEGDEISFTTVVTNGGETPMYNWSVNGMNIGSNEPTYTSTMLNDGDLVQCTITSSSTCSANPMANSNVVEIEVNPFLIPQIQILVNQDSICKGDEIIFTTQAVNEGSTPSYQWFVNGSNVWNDQSTYTTSVLNENDVVTCAIMSSESCLQNNNPVISEDYEVIFNCMNTSNQALFARNFQLFPNPSNGKFVVVGDKLKEVSTIKIMDTQGRVIFEQPNSVNVSELSFNLDKLSTGVYFFSLYTSKSILITKLIIN